MAEYIEREILLKKNFYTENCNSEENRWNDYAIKDIIMQIPAADVAPVRHGRWKKFKGNERPTENGFVHDDRYVCDCCGWGCCCETKLDFNFCPNCGAKNGRG